MDEYTARRQADADFVHEESMRAEAYAEGAAAERERWLNACRAVSMQHAMTGAEQVRAAHFSEAIARLQLAVVEGPNVRIEPQTR